MTRRSHSRSAAARQSCDDGWRRRPNDSLAHFGIDIGRVYVRIRFPAALLQWADVTDVALDYVDQRGHIARTGL
jgi:hypothetical protein